MAQSRSHRTGSPSGSRHAGTWTLVGVLLAAAVVGTLWVPLYNRPTPALGGFPFYYWYQLIWVPAVAVLSGLAYLLVRRIQREPRGRASTGTVPAPRSGQEGMS